MAAGGPAVWDKTHASAGQYHWRLHVVRQCLGSSCHLSWAVEHRQLCHYYDVSVCLGGLAACHLR